MIRKDTCSREVYSRVFRLGRSLFEYPVLNVILRAFFRDKIVEMYMW